MNLLPQLYVEVALARAVARPHVIVNFAMSVDGKIALPTRKQTQISDEDDLRRVHQLRATCDAVLVGVGTILADNPKLTVKPEHASGRNPLRVVLDSEGRTPEDAEVLSRAAPTLIVTNTECAKTFPNAEVARLGKDAVDIPALLDYLGENGVQRLLVEGGEEVIWSFLHGRLADELKVFVRSMVIGGWVVHPERFVRYLREVHGLSAAETRLPPRGILVFGSQDLRMFARNLRARILRWNE